MRRISATTSRSESRVSDAEMDAARTGTIKDSYLVHPELHVQGKEPASIEQVRLAAKGKVQDADTTRMAYGSGRTMMSFRDQRTHFRSDFTAYGGSLRFNARTRGRDDLGYAPRYAPDVNDFAREAETLGLLRERFVPWQKDGFLPTMAIEPGDETERLQRERGWTHWHHLFNPRQLLVLGEISRGVDARSDQLLSATGYLTLTRAADYNSRLSRWHPRVAGDKGEQVFSNQALNTLWNYCCRPAYGLQDACTYELKSARVIGTAVIEPADCRSIASDCMLWVTDPPYADAINYHELGAFFLAWIAKVCRDIFPEWNMVSRNALAVTGSDENFRRSMVDCYQNLAAQRPPKAGKS